MKPKLNHYAKLEGKKVILLKNISELTAVFENDNRQIAFTKIGGVQISTVFLGINHGWGRGDLWFETEIFGGEHGGFQERYETYEQAEAGHKRALDLVRAGK